MCIVWCVYCPHYRCFCLFFSVHGDHRDLHLLTHSFPTRRSSDLHADSLLPVIDGSDPRQPDNGMFGCDVLAMCGDRDGAANRQGHRGCRRDRSEAHTSELQSLMRISYAVVGLKKTRQKSQSIDTLYTYGLPRKRLAAIMST